MKDNNYDHIMEYIDNTANKETRELISYFAILWNLYERSLFKKEHHIKDIWKRVINRFDFSNNSNVVAINNLYDKLKIYLDKKYVNFDYYGLVKYFNVYIKEALIIDGEVQVKKNGEPIYVGEIYEDDFKSIISSSKIKDKLYLLLIIVARVRNNMFHGVKEIEKLDEQIELFTICNDILKLVLSSIRKREDWINGKIIKV